MRAWTVDADDIRVAEDFDAALLHRTPEIEAFLAPGRDDKFIVIGTKGFGKTLLLKAKRVLLQQSGTAACLPEGSLLDKPIGDKIFGKEAIAVFAASPLPWSKVWLTAIALAVLKHGGDVAGLKVGARLAALVADRQLHGVIDHFVRLLDLTPAELQRCATDTDGHLVPRLRALNASVAVFIDGIDEYFNKHVEDQPRVPSVTGELSPNVWFFAQLGLVEVAYQLRRVNHHLKIFAAIRKEAYARLPQRTAMVQQYRGSAVDIAYAPESLREIFVNNVRLVKADRMVQPERAKSNPLEAFFGRTSVVDATTRQEEDAFEYVCRHTLLRPRDLMTIGERLTALKPDERRHEERLKDAVGQAATEIAHEYLAEIAPYVAGLDPERVFGRLPGPVLTRAEMETLCTRADDDGHDGRAAFAALYRTGLLGYVQHDRVRGEMRQRFLRPGDATLDSDGVLPQSAHYLLHPVLFDVVARAYPPFAERIDRRNVIGYDRPWRAPEDDDADVPARETTVRDDCILKADIHAFAALMREGADAPVRRALEDAARRWAPPDAIVEVREGDAVVIVADDPVALAQTARHLMDDVYAAPGRPRLRIALHHGEVRSEREEAGAEAAIAGGDAVLAVARIEPLVEPGQIWVTEAFREQFLERPSLWRTVALESSSGDERFNVKKRGSDEPDLWMRLYRIES